MKYSYICQHCKTPFQGDDDPDRKFCSMHCHRQHRYHLPGARERLFWAKVSKAPHPKGCWLWTGRCVGIGHGILGRSDNGIKTYTVAHRYAWELAGRTIPEGKWLLHHCDTANCVNVDHLYIGTRADNVRDMLARGRHQHGERTKGGKYHNGAKLTEAQVREIHSRYRKGEPRGSNTRELAEEFGVTDSTIQGIAKGRIWKHLRLCSTSKRECCGKYDSTSQCEDCPRAPT